MDAVVDNDDSLVKDCSNENSGVLGASDNSEDTINVLYLFGFDMYITSPLHRVLSASARGSRNSGNDLFGGGTGIVCAIIDTYYSVLLGVLLPGKRNPKSSCNLNALRPSSRRRVTTVTTTDPSSFTLPAASLDCN